MAVHDFESIIEVIGKQLESSRQNWLFGAGISYQSNIPLMYPLTARVKNIIHASKTVKDIEIYNLLTDELPDKAHIEHYLSHLGDLIALADRSKNQSATIGAKLFKKDNLINLHSSIISAISDTVRYGYSNNGLEIIGSIDKPIVEVEHHIKFVQALYSNRTNLLSRSKIAFFTTNYDTLLEDALGLEKFAVVDGFSGGAIAYWNPQIEFKETPSLPKKFFLYKLHGSIDWLRNQEKGLVRTRYGTKYFANKSDIMIYPQATKYVETQKDPFSYLFNGLRNALNANDDNILVTCGYSFGDDHINAEIQAALSNDSNRTTLIAFVQENPETNVVINKTLDSWLTDSNFGDRVYVAGKNGIYHESVTPIQPTPMKDLYGWTFEGLTNFILTGNYE
jgi:SIR2-like domain